uniref:Uncharacterized protein n=1 Tax=Aegilops tauschii subsp. strangulata TaxID=200361 RepID=A0A453IUJ2_AEGTS
MSYNCLPFDPCVGIPKFMRITHGWAGYWYMELDVRLDIISAAMPSINDGVPCLQVRSGRRRASRIAS